MFVDSQVGGDPTLVEGWIAQICPQKCPEDCDKGWEYWDGISWPVDPELFVTCGTFYHFIFQFIYHFIYLVSSEKLQIGFYSFSNVDSGPVDCIWGQWNGWLPCTKTCGGNGTTTGFRSISRNATNGGNNCTGDTEITIPCNEGPCTGIKFLNLNDTIPNW